MLMHAPCYKVSSVADLVSPSERQVNSSKLQAVMLAAMVVGVEEVPQMSMSKAQACSPVPMVPMPPLLLPFTVWSREVNRHVSANSSYLGKH